MAENARTSVDSLTAVLLNTLPGLESGPGRRRPKNVSLSDDLLAEMEREPALAYVEPSELSQAVAGGATVVDVRSREERADGAIAQSLNVPYTGAEFETSARRLLSGRDDLVFYCMNSRERAPSAAYELAKIASPGTSVRVLRGGFQAFVTYLYPDAAKLHTCLENLNRQRWVRIGRHGLVWVPGLDLGFEAPREKDAAD